MADRLIHYTLNSGHSVPQSRESVGSEAIATCALLVKSGGGVILFWAPFRVSILRADGSAVFTIWRAREPLVTCVLAWAAGSEAEAWGAVENLYREIGSENPDLTAPGRGAQKPATLPWLAVVLLPHLVNQRQEDVSWLENFERCMAWTILESN